MIKPVLRPYGDDMIVEFVKDDTLLFSEIITKRELLAWSKFFRDAWEKSSSPLYPPQFIPMRNGGGDGSM